MSFDPEGTALGVQRQEELCRSLVEQRGMTVAAVFVDNDVSASSKSTKPRPQYAEMLARAGKGEFAAIVAYSNSRLTRRPQEYNDLIDIAAQHNVRISTVASGEFDLNTADGRAVARTIAAWDAAESERLSERIKAALAQRRKAGGRHGGPSPWGFVSVNKTLVADPAEAKLIRSAARRLLRGDSIYAIAREWNAKGLRTRHGHTWKGGELRAKLSRQSLMGLNSAGVKAWEPILGARTFKEMQVVIQARPHTNKHETSALSLGLTRCALCGLRMRTSRGGNGYRSLACTRGIHAVPSDRETGDPQFTGSEVGCGHSRIHHDRLEAYVFAQVIAGIEAGHITPHPPAANYRDVGRLNSRLDDLVARKRRNDNAFLEGALSAQDHALYSRQIRVEETAARFELDSALGHAQFDAIVADGLDWQNWTAVRRRNFLSTVITRIEIRPYPLGRKRSPPRPKSMSMDEWLKRDIAFWNMMAPMRVHVVY
ncbi:recombinase family protein [Diaminobutyricibacter tongyongensis]|uniref:Recombinase family protein n=2 Tax=Leifsonia tongyongensis TaxID=1268043 RepID=A0A6L9XTZ3_9MICO|nr:recombinase family protein [Diaminobutyricibacter tongyongensis]